MDKLASLKPAGSWPQPEQHCSAAQPTLSCTDIGCNKLSCDVHRRVLSVSHGRTQAIIACLLLIVVVVAGAWTSAIRSNGGNSMDGMARNGAAVQTSPYSPSLLLSFESRSNSC